MKQHIIETIVGFAVIIIATLFLTFAYKAGGKSHEKGYQITANFQSVEGILIGSDIMVAGIKIGSVKNIILDQNSFLATLYFNIDNDIKLPKDSRAAVVTGGLLGGKYIAITPGSDEENLAANDQIKYTQSAINIESLVNKLVSSFGNK